MEPRWVRAPAAAPQPYFPLHESVRDLLHPDYVDFYNKYLIHSPQAHHLPVSISRTHKGVGAGGPLLPVGVTEDIFIPRQATEGGRICIRCFTPEGQAPDAGWPVMLYFHGGGWVLGDIDSENNVCTHMCARSRCIVITTDYRLAPEHPFPAAIHDCWETFLWLLSEGRVRLNIDATKIAAGGASAGANLAAVIVNRSTEWRADIRFLAQLLVVPILDNTAEPSNNPSWKALEYTASLSSEKMLWYRKQYLPNCADRTNPDASPIFFLASPQSLHDGLLPNRKSRTSQLPSTLIIVGEADILRHEAEVYAHWLQDGGVDAYLHVMQGMPHPFLSMDAVLEAGRDAITLMCDTLSEAFQ